MEKNDELDANGREYLYYAIDASLKISRLAHFFAWTQRELQSLLPHEILICGAGDGAGSFSLHYFTSSHYFTARHFDALCHPADGLMAAVMDTWCAVRQPCLLAPDTPPAEIPACWRLLHQRRDMLDKCELRNIAAHGLTSLSGSLLGFFSFSRIPGRLGQRHAYLLELLAPYLHASLLRALAGESAVSNRSARSVVTPREIQILEHLSQGRTNPEIAIYLSVSPLTVKNHVQNIIAKLGVQNRSHAVAKALNLGIIRTGK